MTFTSPPGEFIDISFSVYKATAGVGGEATNSIIVSSFAHRVAQYNFIFKSRETRFETLDPFTIIIIEPSRKNSKIIQNTCRRRAIFLPHVQLKRTLKSPSGGSFSNYPKLKPHRNFGLLFNWGGPIDPKGALKPFLIGASQRRSRLFA